MKLRVKDNWNKLFDRLEQLEKNVPKYGGKLIADAATQMDANVREHLNKQGRGSSPPSLTSATRKIYSNRNEPDGSGITNHLTLEFRRRGKNTIAILGIPEGKPTQIAKVQDRGHVIKVTEKMRGFLAVNGVFLRQDTTHILVPARYFWYRSLRKTKAKTQQKFKTFFRNVLRLR